MVNAASGGVGAGAAEELGRLLADHGLSANIASPAVSDLNGALRKAIDAAPDLLIVLAGDGTARTAAELSGPDGPVLAPLAGGTMNMLPHAVYGRRTWQEALQLMLEQGDELVLGGGCVEGHRFLCAAILGSPALWAPAREAAREGRPGLAWKRARRAFRSAFTGRLRYAIDGGPRSKAEALVMMCPIASRAVSATEPGLEAAALDINGAGEALRLGINALVRDWRVDPGVENQLCKTARVWSAQGIPALLDGEPVRLKDVAEIRYEPAICRVLALPTQEDPPAGLV